MDVDGHVAYIKKEFLMSKIMSTQTPIHNIHQPSTLYSIGGGFSTMKVNMYGFGVTERCQKIAST